MSNQSRFDTVSLLSASGGSLFNNFCLRPDKNIMQCDVRLVDDTSPWIPSTKVVLLMGETAMHRYLPSTASNTINEMRGSVFQQNGLVFIPCFNAQDAADMKSYEQQLNPLSEHYQPDADEYDDGDEGDVKVLGKTARRNYSFWLRADVRKAKRILALDGNVPFPKQPTYIIDP